MRQESPFNRQPRLVGSAICEALGVYAPDARAFAQAVPAEPVRAMGHEEEERVTLADLLPAAVGNEPVIFVSPDLLFGVFGQIVKGLGPGEPHPSIELNPTESAVRMTVLHELGHHLLRPPDGIRWGTFISEGLANHVVRRLAEPATATWLFAKAWLLQPSAYLTYFVPDVPRCRFRVLSHGSPFEIRSQSRRHSASRSLLALAASSVEVIGSPTCPERPRGYRSRFGGCQQREGLPTVAFPAHRCGQVLD